MCYLSSYCMNLKETLNKLNRLIYLFIIHNFFFFKILLLPSLLNLWTSYWLFILASAKLFFLLLWYFRLIHLLLLILRFFLTTLHLSFIMVALFIIFCILWMHFVHILNLWSTSKQLLLFLFLRFFHFFL